LHRSRNAAGKNPGSTGASHVPRSSAKRSSHGPLSRSGMPSGRTSITSSNATRARRTTLPCGPERSNGFVSSIAVGRSAPRTMNRSISRHSNAAVHHCCTTWRRYPEEHKKTLTAPLRACVRPRAPHGHGSRAHFVGYRAAVISFTARSPDSSAPCIHVCASDVCSPAKWIRPSGVSR